MRDTYEGVDDLASFADDEALRRYRANLLETTRAQVALLERRLPEQVRAVEVAAGNGRLLIALARGGGPVVAGYGNDLARSRIAFARSWAADEGLDHLRFEAGDALLAQLPGEADLVAVLTGALGYFASAARRTDGVLLERLAAAARPGALLCLELYPHHRERRLLVAAGDELRTWHELPPEDPWRFYLSRLVLDGAVLTHTKTFVHRTNGSVDEGRSERLHLYDQPEIEALAHTHGFEAVECLEGWTDRPYAGGETLVVLARRSATA